MMRVTLGILALVMAILAAPAAFAQYASPKTSTTVWDLQQQLSPITLGAGTMYVSGTGVRLAATATSGVVGFYSTDAPFPTNWAVASWNLDEPTGTGFRTEVRAFNGSSYTAWYEIRRDGTIPGGIPRKKYDTYGSIGADTLYLNTTWSRLEYRVTLYSNTVGVTPTLRLMSLCYADTTTLIGYNELPAPGSTTSLSVPWRSQMVVPGIGGVICGPTSMSMALAYNGCNLDTAVVAADCYDDYSKIYGNWPCICQGAAKHGFKAYFSRANNQQPLRDHLAKGYPVEFGMAYNSRELSNSPIDSTDGHLVLVVGIAANGDYICNDPASYSSAYDHVVYNRNEIANVWLNYESQFKRGATVMPCIPNNVYWRYPYFGYKSSDPISINRNGQMELFAKGVNGQVYHMWQTSSNGSWTAWSSMGGTAASDPVTATNRTGGNSVFTRFTDNNLYVATQNTASGIWSGWTSLGGPIAGKPAVGKSPDGRLDVYCRMPNGTIQHRWEDTSSGWQAWASLGGNYPGDPVVGLNWEGREEVFVRGSDSQLYHNYQMNDGAFYGWMSLGGTISGEPSIGMLKDGRLEVFCRFTDGTMRHNWQNTQFVGTAWSGWSSYAGSTAFNVASGRTPAFIQELYSRDSSGAINRAYQTAVDGGWSAWESLGGSSLGAPIVGHNDDGRIQIFTFQSDGKMYSKWQQTSGGWSGWTTLGDSIFSDNVAPVITSTSASPTRVASGDTVSVSATVTDNISVSEVKANGVALTSDGANHWSGTISVGPIDPALCPKTVPISIVAKDPAGNSDTDMSRAYRVYTVVALGNKALHDPVATAAQLKYLFAVCGTVSEASSDQFILDDGSKSPVTIMAPGHGFSNGAHVKARGSLVSGHIEATAASIESMD